MTNEELEREINFLNGEVYLLKQRLKSLEKLLIPYEQHVDIVGYKGLYKKLPLKDILNDY